MIMNHTIDIDEMPVKKDFVRGVSYLTGMFVCLFQDAYLICDGATLQLLALFIVAF